MVCLLSIPRLSRCTSTSTKQSFIAPILAPRRFHHRRHHCYCYEYHRVVGALLKPSLTIWIPFEFCIAIATPALLLPCYTLGSDEEVLDFLLPRSRGGGLGLAIVVLHLGMCRLPATSLKVRPQCGQGIRPSDSSSKFPALEPNPRPHPAP